MAGVRPIDEGGSTGASQFNGVLFGNAYGSLADVDVTGVRSRYGIGATADGFPVLQSGAGAVGVHDGIATASLTDAAAVAAAFNTEFAITASAGQDAILVIHDVAGTRFSAWQYVEGPGAEIQAGELSLIALVSTDEVAYYPLEFL